MDKDLLFDDILKEKANNEKLELPKKLDLKIKETLDNLPERKKKIKFIKRVVIAAAIIVVCGVGVSISFPAFARNLPVVSSVFQYLSEKNIIDKEYIPYSSNLNMSKTYNGITVTINSIVYDGVDLSIGYTVESENEIKETPAIIGPDIRVNGKKVGGGGESSGEFKNKNTYIGVRNIHMAQDYLPKEIAKHIVGGNVKVPEEFIMDFNIKDLSENVKGKWDFKFRVSSEKIKSSVKSIKPNIDLSVVGYDFKVHEIIISPINTVLRFEEKNSVGGEGGFIVLDDKKRVIEVKSSNTSGSEKGDKFYTQTIFKNLYKDSKTLTFIPYVCAKEREKDIIKWMKEKGAGERKNYSKEIPLDLNGTSILQEGKFGDYKVTKVEFLEDKTLVYYECTGFVPFMIREGINIIDDSGKGYDLNRRLSKEIDPVTHKYVGSLPVLDKNKKYKLRAADYENLYELREDAKFTINVNN